MCVCLQGAYWEPLGWWNQEKVIFEAKHDHVVLRHMRVLKIKNEDEKTRACISQEAFL